MYLPLEFWIATAYSVDAILFSNMCSKSRNVIQIIHHS